MAAKSRPMLAVSRRDEDAPRALAVCAPITTSSRGSNYEVEIGKLKSLRERSYVNATRRGIIGGDPKRFRARAIQRNTCSSWENYWENCLERLPI